MNNYDIQSDLAHQLSVRNQIDILRELFKMQYIDAEEYTDRLRDLYEELR